MSLASGAARFVLMGSVGLLSVWTGMAVAGASLRLDTKAFRIIPSESGPTDYYRRLADSSGAFIRASYEPPMKTAVLGHAIPEDLRRRIRSLSWRWRVQAFPVGANECKPGRSDSAAVVYVTWRRGLRWYSVKYVWSSTAKRGSVCERKRNPFAAQDTVVLESGGALNQWRTVRLNPDAEFRKHFEDGDRSADVPDLIGVALMSDGDQTHSKSSADYGQFVIDR